MNPLDWLRAAKEIAADCPAPPVPPEANPCKPLEKTPVPPETPCRSLYAEVEQKTSIKLVDQEELYLGDEVTEVSGCDRVNRGNIGRIVESTARVAQGEPAKSELEQAERSKGPYFTADGTLRIPFGCDPKYHWWKGGQSMKKTIAELRGEPVEELPEEDVPSDCNY